QYQGVVTGCNFKRHQGNNVARQNRERLGYENCSNNTKNEGEAKVIYGYSKEQQIGKRFTPKMKERTRITEKEYQKAIEEHGYRCKECGAHPAEMHHVKYRSQGGKGTYRNLRPLCNMHHRLVHTAAIVSVT